MKNPSYAIKWTQAVERTKRYGLTVPAHSCEPSRRYLNNARRREFSSVVQQGLGSLGPSDLVAQCLAIHYRLAPVVQEWLGCPVIYTLGWIDDGEDELFKFDEKFIVDKLKNGFTGGDVTLHAWLTLPSMELIDVSIGATIAAAAGIQKPTGFPVLTKHADELDGLGYKPMLVGPGFLRKTGALVIGDM